MIRRSPIVMNNCGIWSSHFEIESAPPAKPFRTLFFVHAQVLTALQVLGRGNCFDDICQMSNMGEPTAQRVFHTFCKKFAVEMFDKWIHLPTGEDMTHVMNMYDALGFTGAIGSADVTHVAWGCAPHSHEKSYKGKEGFATLAYQAIVSHSGKVLGVTKGFPGAQNDKTIIRYDLNVQRIRESDIYKNAVYKLRNADGTETEHKGAYLIVDGGYHRVRCVNILAAGRANETLFGRMIVGVW